MAPAHITTTMKPVLGRVSSDSSAISSSANSPTIASPRSSLYCSSPSESHSPRFFSRFRAPRTRNSTSSSSARQASSSAAATPTPAVSSPTAAAFASSSGNRRDSGYFASPRTSMTMTPSARPRAQKRNSGTTMQCGRHANDWLFGGFSFTEAVKDLLRSTDSENGRD